MKKMIALSALSLLSVAAFAEGKGDTNLNYDEITAGYLSQTFTDSDSGKSFTFTGYGFDGSYLITDSIYLIGGYSSSSNSKDFGKDTSINFTRLGVGYRFPMSKETDLNAALSYSNNTFTGSTDTTNYGLNFGIRSVVLSPDLETGLNYVYQMSSQKQDDGTTKNKTITGFNLAAKYQLTKNVFVGLGYLSITNASQYALNLGYKF